MERIESIDISGIRGIKKSPPLNLNGKSVLVFGENGSGKSSLTDAIEWYYSDGIEHLVTEELDSKKGKGALRNLFIPDSEDAYVAIQYSTKALNARKSIDSSYKASTSNETDDFKNFMVASQSERLFLRYRDLVKFIIARKTEKLEELQNIIGFTAVANLRDLLGKSARRIAKHIRTANFDNQKNAKQSVILENLGQNAYTNEQLFAGANTLIKPLKLGKGIKSLRDVADALKEIETKEDTPLFEQISFHTKIGENLSEIVGNVDTINASYRSYHADYTILRKDPQKVKNLQLLTLLKEGQSVLTNDVVQDDYCPLCQQEKNKIDLIAELNVRVEELEELEQERDRVDEQKRELEDVLRVNINTLDGLLKEKRFSEKENAKLAEKVQAIRASLEKLSTELKTDLTAKTPIQEPAKTTIDRKGISAVVKQAQDKATELTESKKTNIQFQIHTRLFQSTTAFEEYQQIDRELGILTKQQETFQALFTVFVKKQEAALNAFLVMFSTDINDYYTAMNPTEEVEDIKLVTIKDSNDELVGITIEYKFLDKTKKVPSAYLSESHVNSLGLSFFLASVKAFNKENGFFVLDDVISSFDRSHRARFAKLLTAEFSDYQILLLTHEQEFFDLVSSAVRSSGWLVRNFVWSKDNGTELEEGKVDSKERILKKLADKNDEGLGNDIRNYTEKMMKEIATNVEAQVAFEYNETNEKRMAPELLDVVHSRISKKDDGLKDKANIPMVQGMPMFIGRTESHDNDFNASIEDLEVMWEGISSAIQAFYCNDCGKCISIKYYDNVTKKIRCVCGNLAYDWKP